jgi:pyruvate formate lyase activating enzyme
MLKEAEFYKKIDESYVQCELCPHYCKIKKGHFGNCLIRKNIDGTLYQTSYGEITSLNVDPIEKKPLYHFYPGSSILSIGTNGCNLKCPFCQNYTITSQETPRNDITLEKLLSFAKKYNNIGVAYTYNEPIIWYEFVRDASVFMKENNLKNVIVSNGNINDKPLLKLIECIDAANIDLKGYTNEFYKWVKGDLNAVKKTIEILFKNGVHTEVTFLLIPNRNDDVEVFKEMCKFLSNISQDIPLHISRYFPTYKCTEPATDIKLLIKFYETAKNYLYYVYVGNTTINDTSNSYCPHCKNLLVERIGYRTIVHNNTKTCKKCSKDLYFVF